MAEKRKITCDCGGKLAENLVIIDKIETEGLVCSKCGFVTLTKKHAQKLIDLKLLHQNIDSERKVIQIGNSIGITLPENLQKLGFKKGKTVKIEAIDHNSFKVNFA